MQIGTGTHENHSIMANDPWNHKFLFALYRSVIDCGEEDFFELIGLQRDTTFDQYLAHYEGDDETMVERAGNDLFSYPPLAEKWREAARESGYTVEKYLHSLTEMIEGTLSFNFRS